MSYEGYTVSLALVDYIPVTLSALGLWLLVKRIKHLKPELAALATIACVVTVSAGILKATWKLIVASSGRDIHWMSDQLFVFLFPGLTLMAFAVILSKRNAPISRFAKAILPIIIIAIVWAGSFYLNQSKPDSRAWSLMLLGCLTISNVILSVALIRQALTEKLVLAACLVALNLIFIFVLSGLGRIEDQTAALQWIEELVNIISQGSLFLGAWLLLQSSLKNESPLPDNNS